MPSRSTRYRRAWSIAVSVNFASTANQGFRSAATSQPAFQSVPDLGRAAGCFCSKAKKKITFFFAVTQKTVTAQSSAAPVGSARRGPAGQRPAHPGWRFRTGCHERTHPIVIANPRAHPPRPATNPSSSPSPPPGSNAVPSRGRQAAALRFCGFAQKHAFPLFFFLRLRKSDVSCARAEGPQCSITRSTVTT